MIVDLERFIQAIPKAELHLHLEGSIAPRTLLELARKHGIALPSGDSSKLYHYRDLAEYHLMYNIACSAMRGVDDFRQITYEALQRSAASGARYVELFFSPQAHESSGIPYPRMLEGIVAGMRDAQADLHLDSRVIPAHNRELGPQRGLEFVEMVLQYPCPEVIGIGLDSLENDPRPFQRMFERARNAGLHVTAHAGEIGPAPFVRDAIATLGSERIDHGYHVVDDAELVTRCRALGTFFTVCPTTTTYKTAWYDLTSAEHPIRRMIAAGLRLTIGTDAPALMRTTLVDEYRIVAKHMRGTPMQLKEISLNGLRASWLDDAVKERRVAEWSAEIDALLTGAAASVSS